MTTGEPETPQSRDATEPYARVLHIDVDTPDWSLVASRRRSRTFFVLWRAECAVGHVWVDERDDPTPAVQRALVTAPRAPAVAGPVTPPSTVSVVICTRDRPGALVRCLASFGNQSRRPDEVIVVDNASRAAAETQAATLAAGATYIREDRPGLDIARNTGMLAARSQVVAYTDDDTELHPRWLECLVGAFSEDHVVAVTGLVLPAELDTEPQWLFERDWGFGKGYLTRDFDEVFYEDTRTRGCPAWEVGAGANMAFRASVVDRVGLFDERLDVGAAGCSGDSEYWYRILADGGTCRYEPSAIVYHHHRRDLEGLARQLRYYMRGHAAALLVQYERTGDRGNLRRLVLSLPAWYLRLVAHRICGRTDAPTTALLPQVLGLLSGVAFYLRRSPLVPRVLRHGG
ncbi:Glycosyltransferase, GT2 family [Geodermatophilus telluris]|uniref:Glycosyltransferase, GT2 family n=1 Tax=Geodermatophilus telluris TaxID=1190417 RepID=A0A1G6L8R8_9ACTN|nr:glycosyltransferase [Geodermatophilus telluris]SDC38926.1 Glycosyltransferase, GT2 family [Geodermatophilus telluris]